MCRLMWWGWMGLLLLVGLVLSSPSPLMTTAGQNRTVCSTVLNPEAEQQLKALFPSSQLFFPGDAKYPRLSSQYNPIYDNASFPFAILRASSEDDVVAAVKWARASSVCLSIKSSGHSPDGSSVLDRTLLLDLALLDSVSVSVSASAPSADLGPGADNADLVAALRPYGLIGVWGGCTTVSMGGYLQGGGEGAAARVLGYGVDNLLSVRLVSAEGALITASPSLNPDLFWALRGGGGPGGNFGVVVSFRVSLSPAPPSVLNFAISYSRAFPSQPCAPVSPNGTAPEPPEVAAAVSDLAAFADLFFGQVGGYPDAMGIGIEWTKSCSAAAPGVGPFPNVTVTLFGTYFGDSAEGLEMLAIYQSKFPSVSASVQVNTTIFKATEALYLSLSGPSPYYLSKQRYILQRPPLAFSLMQTRAMLACPSSLTQITLYLLGGVPSRVPPTQTVYYHRDALFNFYYYGYFDSPSLSPSVDAWLQHFFALSLPFLSSQAYQNWPDPSLGVDSWPSSYYGPNLDRLLSIKRFWDPSCFLQFPQSLCQLI